MGFVSLECQTCLYRTRKVTDFKKHMQSPAHVLKVQDVFPGDAIKRIGSLPFIDIFYQGQRENSDSIIGVSALTLCMFLNGGTVFYLCHTCEQTCAFTKILEHLSSEDHYCSYFSHTNPNALSFSWISGMDVIKNVHTEVIEETRKGQALKILHLPVNLMNEFKSSPYSEVMNTLRGNEKLLKLFEAVQPKRTTIQTYQKDSKRKYPLLGLQHLVECICVGSSEKNRFICTLCGLTVASRMIIKHVLSFHHIFCYFKAWHPSTLLSEESYHKYTTFFASGMLKLSKQSEQVHGTENADVKTVSLEPDEFKLMNFTSYTAALKKLESITGSSLIATITPGEKLESSIATPPSAASYKLCCQVCGCYFDKVFQYIRHLSQRMHRQNWLRHFGEADAHHHDLANICLGLHVYVKNCLDRNEPAVGAHLVVTIITTQVEEDAVYLCFACQKCFSQLGIDQHFTSRKHLIHTLLYHNPWRLPFGWEDDLEDADLTLRAWEEEKQREPHQMSLKVFDIPHSILQSFTPLSYSKVLEGLQLYHRLLRGEVPPRETYSKLQENERFPLLGRQFLVRWLYDDGETQQSGSLCLLCKRLLSDIDFSAHDFSREHVAAFLNCFHPGSLNSSTPSVEILLDLAKQAARIHPIEHVQEVMVDRLIREPCPYNTVRNILQAAKRSRGNRSLEPLISPKMKLVPRKNVQEVGKNQVSSNSQTSNINTNKLCAPSGQHQENKDGQTTPTPSANVSAMKSNGFSSSENMKNADKTCQAIKVPTEEPSVTKPSGDIPGSSQSTDRDDGAEKNESSKEIPAQQKNDAYKEGGRKRSSSMSEVSQKTTCRDEDVREDVAHKRRRLTCDEVYETNNNMPNSEQSRVENTADVEKRQKAAMSEGSNTPLQCVCDRLKPNHLCEYCSLENSKTGVISHTAGFDHQETHLVVDMEIDDSDDFQAAEDVSAMFDTTFKTTEAPPELKENDTMAKVPESAGSSHTSVTVPQRSGDMLNPNVSTSGKNTTPLPPDFTFSGCKGHSTQIKTVASVKMTTTSKREEQPAASSKLTGSTSNAASSNSTTKSAAMFRSPESRTGVASEVKTVSFNAAPASDIRSSVLREATGRTAPSANAGNPPKCSEAVLPSETPKTSVKCGNNETSTKTVHVKHSRGENAKDPRLHKNNQLAAATTAKKPQMKTTQTSGVNAKQTNSGLKIGLNQLILVSCEGKKQVYCQLCSVKLIHSSKIHLTDRRHQINYVNLCYPGDSQKLDKIEATIEHLAYVEKKLQTPKIQEIEVSQGVYNELRVLPQEKVFEKLKKIMGKRDTQASSSFTAVPAETLKRDAACASPCEVSSTNDDSHVGEEASVAATRSVRAQSFDGSETPADDSIQYQLHTSPKSNENDPEPNPGPSIQAEEKRAVTREKLVTNSIPETGDSRQQQRRSSAELHVAQKMPEGEKPECGSLLSTYLKVKCLDTKPIIGLGSVWECQGISQKTFFLCESCSKMVSVSDICEHMVSFDHKLQCMRTKHGKIMSLFETLDHIELPVFEEAVEMISSNERIVQADAQVVLLGHGLYESVRTASFSEALKIVQSISEKKQSTFCLPISTSPQKNQQPVSRQSPEESLPTEMQSAESPKTNQRGHNAKGFPKEASHIPKKPHLDATPMAEDLNGAKDMRVSSPRDVKCFSSKADSVVSPSPAASTHLSPQEACSRLSVKRAFTPPPPQPQPQSRLSPVRVKQGELHSQTPSSAAPLPSQDDAEPKSDQLEISTAYWNELIALVKEGKKKNLSSCRFAPDSKHFSSCVTSLSGSMEEMFDSTQLKTEFGACDSSSTTATGYRNQVVPQANSASSTSNSSPVDYLTMDNPLFGATEGKTASAIVPTATTAQLPSYPATNHNPRQILQPQGDTKTGVSLLPINTIITDRPPATKYKFNGSNKVENHFKMNTEQQVSLSLFQSTNPSDTMAASGEYGRTSHSVYLPCQPVSSYTPPNNPVVHTGSLYQHHQYPGMQFYPNQPYPEQWVNPCYLQTFGNSLATPMFTGWESLGMQLPPQQQLTQQQQQQLQQLMQQQQQQLQQLIQQQQREKIMQEQHIQQLQMQVQQLQHQQLEQPQQQQQVQQQLHPLSWANTWQSSQ